MEWRNAILNFKEFMFRRYVEARLYFIVYSKWDIRNYVKILRDKDLESEELANILNGETKKIKNGIYSIKDEPLFYWDFRNKTKYEINTVIYKVNVNDLSLTGSRDEHLFFGYFRMESVRIYLSDYHNVNFKSLKIFMKKLQVHLYSYGK